MEIFWAKRRMVVTIKDLWSQPYRNMQDMLCNNMVCGCAYVTITSRIADDIRCRKGCGSRPHRECSILVVVDLVVVATIPLVG